MSVSLIPNPVVDPNHAGAISFANTYIDINKQCKGTFEGDDVDDELKEAKVERLLAFSERQQRSVNTASETSLFTAGQIMASPVTLKILRTQVSAYVVNQFAAGACIPEIVVYRVDIIGKKHKITEKIKYSDCYIESWEERVDSADPTRNAGNLSTLTFTIRFEKREQELRISDQRGRPMGTDGTLIDFSKGDLERSQAEGGEGGGEAAEAAEAAEAPAAEAAAASE